MANLRIIPVDEAEFRKKTEGKKKYSGDFYILVGHRRHAAAAELADVPCAIELGKTEAEQVGIMLEESVRNHAPDA